MAEESNHPPPTARIRAILLNSLMPAFVTEYPQFFSGNIIEWQKLLEPDNYKDIIINSLRFLAEEKHIQVYAFVIMYIR